MMQLSTVTNLAHPAQMSTSQPCEIAHLHPLAVAEDAEVRRGGYGTFPFRI